MNVSKPCVCDVSEIMNSVNSRNCICSEWCDVCEIMHLLSLMVFDIIMFYVFLEFANLCFLWNRYVCICVKLRSCELNAYHEYATLLFSDVIKSTLLWICEIVICVNVANARTCYFRKSRFLNCCDLSKVLFVWRLRVSAFDIFVSSRILLFMNFRHHYLSKKLEFVHFLILWSHEFCIVVNSRNGCSYEGCDFLHVLSSWNHDNCIFNEFAKSLCFTFVGILLCGILIELVRGDTNGLSI